MADLSQKKDLIIHLVCYIYTNVINFFLFENKKTAKTSVEFPHTEKLERGIRTSLHPT